MYDGIQDALSKASELLDQLQNQNEQLARIKKILGVKFLRSADIEAMWDVKGVMADLEEAGISFDVMDSHISESGKDYRIETGRFVMTEPLYIDDRIFNALMAIKATYGASVNIVEGRAWIRPLY